MGKDMVTTARMSTKGQIVIPEQMRVQLNLSGGSEFLLIQVDDDIVMQKVKRPPQQDLFPILERAEAKIKELGLRRKVL